MTRESSRKRVERLKVWTDAQQIKTDEEDRKKKKKEKEEEWKGENRVKEEFVLHLAI